MAQPTPPFVGLDLYKYSNRVTFAAGGEDVVTAGPSVSGALDSHTAWDGPPLVGCSGVLSRPRALATTRVE
jgi:hypothetical protein